MTRYVIVVAEKEHYHVVDTDKDKLVFCSPDYDGAQAILEDLEANE